VVHVGGRDCEAALKLGERANYRGTEADALGEFGFDEVWDDFGVGVTLEEVAVKLGLEVGVVRDDSVVDDRNVTAAVGVGVGVGVGRLAVGRPPGVADAVGGVHVAWEGEPVDGALLFADGEIVADEGDACRVVAAIL
jgi:hypothetical protein